MRKTLNIIKESLLEAKNRALLPYGISIGVLSTLILLYEFFIGGDYPIAEMGLGPVSRLLLSLALTVLISLATIIISASVYNGYEKIEKSEEFSSKDILVKDKMTILRVLVVTIVIPIVVVFGSLLLALPFIFVLGLLPESVTVAAATVFLVAGGLFLIGLIVIMSLVLASAQYRIIILGENIKDSLLESWKLVKSFFPSTLLFALILGILTNVFTWLVTTIYNSVLGSAVAAGELNVAFLILGIILLPVVVLALGLATLVNVGSWVKWWSRLKN